VSNTIAISGDVRVVNNNTTGVTSGAETAHPSETLDVTLGY